jgi:hypothetical protein
MSIRPKNNVIPLWREAPFASRAVQEMDCYWQALADGRLMPRRAEIDPRGLVGALDRTFLLERIAQGQARFRVAGSRLSTILEMELRGLPLSTLFHPAARPELAEALAAVFEEPARLSLNLDGSGPLGLRNGQAECLILPLRDDGGAVTRAIGCLDWPDKAPPQRFRIRQARPRTLIGYGERLASRPAQEKGPDATRPTLTLVT